MPDKPKVQLSGTDGNVFALLGICIKALRKAGLPEEANSLREKVTASKSYDEALMHMMDSCDVS